MIYKTITLDGITYDLIPQKPELEFNSINKMMEEAIEAQDNENIAKNSATPSCVYCAGTGLQRKGTQEPPKVARPRAEEGKPYFYMGVDGDIRHSFELDLEAGYRHSVGNYFLTEEACEAANPTKYNQALTRVRDYIKINFSNSVFGEKTFFPRSRHYSANWHFCLEYDYDHIISLPKLASQEDCEQLIRDCKDDLDIIRTEGERLNNL